jgi:hypothetical protein
MSEQSPIFTQIASATINGYSLYLCAKEVPGSVDVWTDDDGSEQTETYRPTLEFILSLRPVVNDHDLMDESQLIADSYRESLNDDPAGYSDDAVTDLIQSYLEENCCMGWPDKLPPLSVRVQLASRIFSAAGMA